MEKIDKTSEPYLATIDEGSPIMPNEEKIIKIIVEKINEIIDWINKQ